MYLKINSLVQWLLVSTLNVNYRGKSSNPTTWKEAVGVDNDHTCELFFGYEKKKILYFVQTFLLTTYSLWFELIISYKIFRKIYFDSLKYGLKQNCLNIWMVLIISSSPNVGEWNIILNSVFGLCIWCQNLV